MEDGGTVAISEVWLPPPSTYRRQLGPKPKGHPLGEMRSPTAYDAALFVSWCSVVRLPSGEGAAKPSVPFPVPLAVLYIEKNVQRAICCAVSS
jgi:hypothetical protein